jgi:hypothetical protein
MRGGWRNGGRPKGSKNSGPRRGSKAYEALHAGDKKPRKRSTPALEPTEADKLKRILALGEQAKKKTLQEFIIRVANQDGQQKPLTLAEKRYMDKLGAEIGTELKPDAPKPEGEKTDLEAHEYLRQVWNDPNVETALRIRAAEIAFKGPESKLGKKDLKDVKAKQAGAGRFAASAPPQLAIVGKK